MSTLLVLIIDAALRIFFCTNFVGLRDYLLRFFLSCHFFISHAFILFIFNHLNGFQRLHRCFISSFNMLVMPWGVWCSVRWQLVLCLYKSVTILYRAVQRTLQILARCLTAGPESSWRTCKGNLSGVYLLAMWNYCGQRNEGNEGGAELDFTEWDWFSFCLSLGQESVCPLFQGGTTVLVPGRQICYNYSVFNSQRGDVNEAISFSYLPEVVHYASMCILPPDVDLEYVKGCNARGFEVLGKPWNSLWYCIT